MGSLKDVEKYYEERSKFRRKCYNCRHTIYLSPVKNKSICDWCGVMNYYDEKEEFKNRLKNALKK